MFTAIWTRMKITVPILFVLIGLFLVACVLQGFESGAAARAQEPDSSVATEKWVAPAPPRLEELEAILLDGGELVGLALRDLQPEQLRVLRNTIYARHGKVFKDEALQALFESKASWYVPSMSYDDAMLTAEDHRNIAAILMREGRVEDAHWQESLALQRQAEELSDVADNMEVLNAYLVDRQSVDDGLAPDGFVQPSLQAYKADGITSPLTK